MLGIFDNIFSKLSFNDFCSSVIFSKNEEISLDFANKDLSFDFEISFFSFSNLNKLQLISGAKEILDQIL